jgi:hypothetical protein
MASPFFARKPASGRWASRLTLELIAVVIVKIAALGLLWWVAFAPYPKPARGRDAIERLLAPNSAIPSTHESTP